MIMLNFDFFKLEAYILILIPIWISVATDNIPYIKKVPKIVVHLSISILLSAFVYFVGMAYRSSWVGISRYDIPQAMMALTLTNFGLIVFRIVHHFSKKWAYILITLVTLIFIVTQYQVFLKYMSSRTFRFDKVEHSNGLME
ncbi:MAG: hypothetical protein U0525_05920 [Patescibacteria group bacterium]